MTLLTPSDTSKNLKGGDVASEHEPVAIGQRIKSLRLSKGLKQQDLVSDKVSLGYVSLIEQGKRTPSGKALSAIAESLGVSLATLTVGDSSEISARDQGLIALAEGFLAQGRISEALSFIDDLPAHITSHPNVRLIVGICQFESNQASQAWDTLDGVLDEFLELSDWEQLRRAILYLGRADVDLGRPIELLIRLRGILQSLDQAAYVDPLLGVQIRAIILNTHQQTGGGPIASAELTSQIMQLLPSVTDHRAHAMALWSISFGAWVEKNFDESYALALRSRELFQAAEDAQTVPRITTVTARALARSSITDENQVRHMIGLIDDSLMEIGNSVESYDRTYLLASKAELLVKIGDFVAADTVLASIEDVIVKEVDYAGSHYLHAGEVALNIGTTAKALENFSKSRRAIDQLSDKDAAEAAFLRGRLADNYKAIGDTETAFEIARGIKLVDVPVG